MQGELKEEEYETEDVSVQIVELSTDDLAKENHWIGANRPVYTTDNTNGKAKEESDEEADPEEAELVPGFGITTKTTAKKAKKKPEWKVSDIPIETENPDDPEIKKKTDEKGQNDFKSKRAMGQFLAKKAQSTLKQSKAFQTKNKLERTKNKKKARFEREKRIKLQNKREKHGKKSTKPKKTKSFSRHKK